MKRHFAVAAAIGLALTSSAALAGGDTNQDTTILACAKNNNGQLRVVEDSEDCNNSEHLIAWNSDGPAGTAGPQGEPGPQGDQGAQGSPGPAGDQGEPGPQGDQGDQGPQGDQGDQGDQGPQGDQGDQGPQGDQGDQGPQGDQGDQGDQGEQGPQGDQGDQGEQGEQGDQGDQGDQGPSGASAYELAVRQGFSGSLAEYLDSLVGPEGEGRTINLTIDPAQFPGITAQDFGALFSDVVANTALLDVSGICTTSAVVINGPGVEIQVVEGFDQLGRHDDVSGLAVELPFVFEIPASDACAANMQQYFDQYLADPASFFPRPFGLFVTDSIGDEAFHWNFFNYAPEGYAPGLEGTRFTMYQRLDPIGVTMPRRQIELQRFAPSLSDPFGLAASFNPATDKLVEFQGFSGLGIYPAVVAESDRVLTLAYDYVEGGGLWPWVEDFAENGTDVVLKRAVSVATLDEDLNEIARTLYFGCFPVKYEQFTGFFQDIQTKERVILSCDFSQHAE